MGALIPLFPHNTTNFVLNPFRTIVNGLCYLATFVFGINSIGLFLYSGQLVLNSFMEDSNSNETDKEGEQQSGVLKSTAENARDSIESNSSKED